MATVTRRTGVDELLRYRYRLNAHTRAYARAVLLLPVFAALLWLVWGQVGFVNYDTLYALVWAQQLWRGETPQYDLPVAPTPHPLAELLGLPLAPLGAGFTATATVAGAFLALAACGWVVYLLGREWAGRAAGLVAAGVLLTRVPVISYGVRAYVDVPYMGLVLGALLVETRRPRAGAPVLALLALAGLLRPEAWAFSGVYWLYLAWAWRRARAAQLARLTLLAAAAPAVWVASDLLVSGHPLWSLTNTKHTARELGRVTGIGNVPEYIPRRVGEVVRIPALAGAAVGGVLSLLWLGARVRIGAAAGAIAVVVFAVLAGAGLPIDTRYAFLIAAILCVFCGVGVFGWLALPLGDRRRRAWAALGMLVLVALVALLPGQIRSADRELSNLSRQQSIQGDLLALVKEKALTLKCGPVGVPNHAPVPLLALYLKAAPSRVVSAEAQPIAAGIYVDPASLEVERGWMLDPRDPHKPVQIPPGFSEAHANRSWLLFQRCG